MRTQNIQRSTQALLAALLVIALAGMINWLGARHWKRADWTESQMYTLSEKSLNIIKGLHQDLDIVVFMTPASQLYPQVRELLDRYDAASDRIKVEFIDPERSPLRTKELAEKFGISAADTVVFSSGDHSKYVTSDQMAELDYSGMQMGQPPRLKSFKGEEEFTAAILSLASPEVPKVYVLKGHGEAGLAPAGASDQQRSLSRLKTALEHENMKIEECSIMAGHVPDDAALLIIAGPTRAYTEREIAALSDYLRKGGHLLAALDPLIDTGGGLRSTGLEPLLKKWGVELQPDLVIDPSRKLPFYDLSAVYLDSFGHHPVTTGMEGLAVLFLVADSLQAVPESGLSITPLVQTTPDGWGETNLAGLLKGEPVSEDDTDLQGPVPVAMAVESDSLKKDDASEPAGKDEEKKEADEHEAVNTRLVVFGDSDFMTDTQIVSAGNEVLIVNAAKWLVQQDRSLGIPPREISGKQLFLSSSQLNFIFLLVVVLMPGAAILAGIFVWRRRKH